jgi:phosphoribosylaminoimidazolecarboxamide formyltransferase/IMP cyclohydrolase
MKAALLSVSDTTNLEKLATTLVDLGFALLTTTGTGKYLSSRGINSISLEDYTGYKEILGGRVKSLHPKIHGGILAKRDSKSDLDDLKSIDAFTIDVVVVTLYPFREKAKKEMPHREQIELVDIGGATLLRAAAKNCEYVLVVSDPSQYPDVIDKLSEVKSVEALPFEYKKQKAIRAFTLLADDTLSIAKLLSNGEVEGEVLTKFQDLRYGENPHQEAGFFKRFRAEALPWKQHQGKELSYNNLLDLDASFSLIEPFFGDAPTAIIIKHTNPCGVGIGESLLEAVKRAKKSDPRSHFGGIVVVNRKMDVEEADEIASEFAEIVVAPDFTDQALIRFSKNKNLRVVSFSAFNRDYELRSSASGFLIQSVDTVSFEYQVAGRREPTKEELEELNFAWKVCARVKSNAIVLAKEKSVIGVGAGQMSRIDSVELCLHKAKIHGHSTKGSVCASDAFFPFPDSVTALGEAGISAILAPGGAKRDEEVIAEANRFNIALLFSKYRHFRH